MKKWLLLGLSLLALTATLALNACAPKEQAGGGEAGTTATQPQEGEAAPATETPTPAQHEGGKGDAAGAESGR